MATKIKILIKPSLIEMEIKRIERIKETIKTRESVLSRGDFLIFNPPKNDTLYTIDELTFLLKESLLGLEIPLDLKIVQKSHWVKFRVLKALGYNVPSGLRSKDARKYKPKFINQLLDIFVQKSNNLQVWNYIPYSNLKLEGCWNKEGLNFQDCRYLLVRHNSKGVITNIMIKSGKELKNWDNTGTKTIKWQATIAKHFWETKQIIVGRNDPISEIYCNNTMNTDEKNKLIYNKDFDKNNPLIKKKPDANYLYSIYELSELLDPLLNLKVKKLGSGKERIIGQFAEKKVAELLGYRHYTITDTGNHPDLINQLLEVKFQYSPTIDLGQNLPTENDVIKGFEEIDSRLTHRHVRYCLILACEYDDYYEIISIIITSGMDFEKFFTICKGTNFKVQFKIKWLEEDYDGIKEGNLKILDFLPKT